jgi:uncharacterized membrane protein (UPF0127 family)
LDQISNWKPAYGLASPKTDWQHNSPAKYKLMGLQPHLASDMEPRGQFSVPGARQVKDAMQKRKYCVYNQTRESFLSLGVTVANTTMTRLKGLIGKLSLGLDEGLWIVPSHGIHTMGVLFPIDLIYLDDNLRVLHAVESFPTFRVSPLIPRTTSVLELPTHTIYSSQTQPGDQLLICAGEEMENHLKTTSQEFGYSAK